MIKPTRAQLRKNLQALRERLEAKPEDLDARMRMARTHGLLGEGRQAIAHYRSVARYLSLSGQPLRAITVLKELLALDPKHEETLLFLAKLYARTRSADRSNTGRVAVPIVDDTGPLALPEGMPAQGSALWRAIRPQSTDVFTVVHELDEIGADEDLSIAAELRELDEAYELDDDDVIEERALRPEDPSQGTHRDDAAAKTRGGRAGDAKGAKVGSESASDAASQDPFADVDAFDYEVIGPLTTQDILLPQVPLFSTLPIAAFIELGHAMVFQRARPGELVFQEGEPGDSCIVISRGQAVALRRGRTGGEVELMRLGEGDFAGVFALAAGQPRQASLRAESHLEFFEIDRLALKLLVDRHPDVSEALQTFFRGRLVLNILAGLPLFAALGPDERQSVAASFVERQLDDGAELFAERFEHDGLWIVVEGKVQVQGEEQKVVRELNAGDYLGSVAGTMGRETQLSAVSIGQTELAVLLPKDVARLLAAHHDVERALEALHDLGLMIDDAVFAGTLESSAATERRKPLLRG